jgi:hypothetical protein
MNINAVLKAINEAQRFINKADEYIEAEKSKCAEWTMLPKESGALKRSSMDLTRALSQLRKP